MYNHDIYDRYHERIVFSGVSLEKLLKIVGMRACIIGKIVNIRMKWAGHMARMNDERGRTSLCHNQNRKPLYLPLNRHPLRCLRSVWDPPPPLPQCLLKQQVTTYALSLQYSSNGEVFSSFGQVLVFSRIRYLSLIKKCLDDVELVKHYWGRNTFMDKFQV